MQVQCPFCDKKYRIAEERIRKHGSHVVFPCPACQTKIEVRIRPEEPAGVPAFESSSTAGLTGEALMKIVINSIGDLPPMPQVAGRARQISANPNSSLSDLSQIIETDQAIAARVIKLANSAFYGVAGTVSSIQTASVVLGMKTLSELLSVACTAQVLGTRMEGYGMSSGALWRHSLAVAACARAIAAKKAPDCAEDAFAVGLLHDCGKLILNKHVYERKTLFQDFMRDGKASFLEAEQAILGFDHSEIASSVCEKWNVPGRLTHAIQNHHSPSTMRFNELTHIVHAADAIVLRGGVGVGRDGLLYQMNAETAEFLNFDSGQAGKLLSDANGYVEKTVGALMS